MKAFSGDAKQKKWLLAPLVEGRAVAGILHRRAGRREVQAGEAARWNAMKCYAQPARKGTFLLILDLLQFSGERFGACLVSFSN